jgi:tetratricopeptide (TPR) repeat protein
MGFGRTRRVPLSCIVAAALVLASFDVRADGPREGAGANAEKARELARESADAYRHGDFARAIARLREAYALDPQPVLLYNEARAHEGLGETDAAIASYEQYLHDEPAARDRGSIEQRLVTLRRQRDERAALERARTEPSPAAAPPVAPPPPQPPPTSRDEGASVHGPMPWVVGGIGVAGIGAGAVFGMLALSRKDDAVGSPVQRDAIDLKNDATNLATVSTVSFIVGGVLAAVGVGWWLVESRASSRSAQRTSAAWRSVFVP